ncbi:cytidine deaminase [Echinicola sp. CAU 1574]|uniref:Cytidine deaminase n=1 Tax=Echinicola arenosa TaxID=2774144 RepID=A0ABR9AH13_9BACT|nr:cytidine deaminase [Echinicola arenosa]MBD8488081.1 cytidine deaminase [Echinicola arenosa]
MGKKITQNISLTLLDIHELDEKEIELVNKAKNAMNSAYAPYSNFMVGAAILLENDEILTANNQENASFPVGICAERLLLGYAHANFPKLKPLKIAIIAKKKGSDKYATVSPCGLCRQTINEYEVKFETDIQILMYTPNDQILKAANISKLLPFKFNDLNS